MYSECVRWVMCSDITVARLTDSTEVAGSELILSLAVQIM